MRKQEYGHEGRAAVFILETPHIAIFPKEIFVLYNLLQIRLGDIAQLVVADIAMNSNTIKDM